MAIKVPPLKTQGKKTKLVEWLLSLAGGASLVIEPFCGSGAFSLNSGAERAVLNDVNPHATAFYRGLRDGSITPGKVRSFLEREGALLSKKGEAHYLERRDEFNRGHDPLLYLFLNRSCFNGVTRFNSKGGFNVPFCKRPDRFSRTYITKIANQCEAMAAFLKGSRAEIRTGDFEALIREAPEDALVYCDPPYIGVNSGYFTPWTERDQDRLLAACRESRARVMVSSWLDNGRRENPHAAAWKKAGFRIHAKSHEWICGPKTENRPAVREAAFCNFRSSSSIC